LSVFIGHSEIYLIIGLITTDIGGGDCGRLAFIGFRIFDRAFGDLCVPSLLEFQYLLRLEKPEIVRQIANVLHLVHNEKLEVCVLVYVKGNIWLHHCEIGLCFYVRCISNFYLSFPRD
jgi:hypothetical protein